MQRYTASPDGLVQYLTVAENCYFKDHWLSNILTIKLKEHTLSHGKVAYW